MVNAYNQLLYCKLSENNKLHRIQIFKDKRDLSGKVSKMYVLIGRLAMCVIHLYIISLNAIADFFPLPEGAYDFKTNYCNWLLDLWSASALRVNEINMKRKPQVQMKAN